MEYYDKTSQVVPRPKPMKVLALGLPRTGTKSLCAAFEKLGMRAYHYDEIAKNMNNQHAQLWLQAIDAKFNGAGKPFLGQDFDAMLWNYDVVSGSPCFLFAQELLGAYPDARVILTTRPTPAWLRSLHKSILKTLSWTTLPILASIDGDESSILDLRLLNRTYSIMSNGFPPYQPAAYPELIQTFEEHNRRIRETVPAERLLEFHPKDGWGPLCAFLGMPVPEGDFPFVDYANSAEREYWMYVYHTLRKVAKQLLLPGLVLCAAVYLGVNISIKYL